ncbi:MAG: helicase HerA domain-containing protein [Candidatus Norongarragalinales archaeon]
MSFEIGKTLGTNEPFLLDIPNIVTGRTFIASITRYGKSWSTRKICEECFGHAGIIIIDPEGEYISLREKYPFLIIGKDIPLQLETAEFMADKILESNISVIIDLSLTEVELGKEYVDKLLRRFFFLETTLRKPYLIVVEEAEELCPERGIATTTCLEILRNITKKGGKRGIGIIVIAHRPAWLSKGILSQCTNKAIGRIDWPSDLNVLEEYARIPKSAIEKLPTLDKGEFCFAGDWVKEFTFVKVGPVKTQHLGFTPEVIPPSPRELKSVIESLQKALPEVIEKIKPTVVPVAEMEAKIKGELEKKYRERIEAIQRTAEEKAERKYKAKIDQLQTQLDNLARTQALQPVAPVSDPLQHPIVKARMAELPDKARDLLIKVEREPGLTREQLAAFLTTSKDTVASLVDKINRVFRATAIIGDGKPIRYKSMLKRLFITDVAKREIEEIERLQKEVQEERIKREQAENLLRQTKEHYKGLEEFYLKHKTDIENLPSLEAAIRDLKSQNQALTETVKKQEALFGPFLDFFRAIVKEEVSRVQIPALDRTIPEGPPIDEKKIETLIEEKLKEKLPATSPPSGVIPTSVELEHKVTHFDFQKIEEHIKADTTTLQGRIIYLITKGFFDQRHNRKEVVTELSNHGWIHDDKEVDNALLELCQLGILYRKISTGARA